MDFLKKFLNKKGESIIEVMIAAVVITLTATAAAVLLSSAFASNALTRDRMRAINLAKEGLEAVRNIRDTNILRSGAFKDSCWNFLEILNEDNTCNDKIIQATPFRLIQEGRKQLILTDDYKWYLLDKGNVTGNYHDDFKVVPLDLGAGANDPTVFYRVIDIKYFELNSTTGNPSTISGPEDATIMSVTSTVYWKFKGQENKVVLKTMLSKYN